jgi:hypothetical protein
MFSNCMGFQILTQNATKLRTGTTTVKIWQVTMQLPSWYIVNRNANMCISRQAQECSEYLFPNQKQSKYHQLQNEYIPCMCINVYIQTTDTMQH